MDEITKCSEELLTYFAQLLSSITEGKRKNTKPDEAAGKKAITSVESPQMPVSLRAGTSAEHSLQWQVKQRARTSVKCTKRKREVSDSDPSLCARQYVAVMKRRNLRNL